MFASFNKRVRVTQEFRHDQGTDRAVGVNFQLVTCL